MFLNYDRRDNKFKFSRLVGIASELPSQVIRAPRKIENQEDTNFCTAAAVTTASEYQENEDFSLEYQVAKISFLMGKPIYEGADMRKALKSAIAFGSLRKADTPYLLEVHGPSIVANWKGWDPKYDDLAKPFRKAAFLPVDKPFGYSWFDVIRNALQHNVVIAGGKWYWDWDSIGTDGILPAPINYKGLHAYVIYGYQGDYLLCQNSYGEGYGKQGVFLMHRDIVDTVWSGAGYNGTGLFTYRDIDNTQVDNLKLQWTSLLDILADLLYRARYALPR